MHLADPMIAGSAIVAFSRMMSSPVLAPEVRRLRAHVVSVVLAADLCVAADAIPADGTDDALLDAAHGIARLVDPGAG